MARGGMYCPSEKRFYSTRVPVLSPQRARELIERAQRGDTAARDELVEKNLGLVKLQAIELRNCGVEINDLVHEGVIGLMAAIERFEITRSTRFSSYAIWWIRKMMYEHVAKHGSFLKLPARQSLLVARGVVLRGKHPSLSMREFSELAQKELGISKKKADQLLGDIYRQTAISLDVPRSNGKQGLAAQIQSPYEGQGDALFAEELVANLRKLFEKLSPKQRHVLIEHFDLNDTGEEKTLAQVAAAIGISREAARKLKKNAIQSLGKRLARRLHARPRPA